MTEDHEFNEIILSSYCVHAWQLLTAEADIAFFLYPQAKNWVFNNAPDYLFEIGTPVIELVDQIGFGIEGFVDVHLMAKFPEHLLDNPEPTEGKNNETNGPAQGSSD